MIEWNDHKRFASELKELEADLNAVESAVSSLEAEHCDLTERLHAARTEKEDISTLQEVVNILPSKGNDLNSKLNEISDKEDEISLLAPNATKVDQKIALEKKVKHWLDWQ